VEVSQEALEVVHFMDRALHKVETFLNLLHQVQVQGVALDFNMMDRLIMVAQVAVQGLQYLQ
jgi:hypothetical protein